MKSDNRTCPDKSRTMSGDSWRTNGQTDILPLRGMSDVRLSEKMNRYTRGETLPTSNTDARKSLHPE